MPGFMCLVFVSENANRKSDAGRQKKTFEKLELSDTRHYSSAD